MDYRTRYLATLRGDPVDRLPFIETAKFDMVRAHSDWNKHLRADNDPLEVFGFDNTAVPAGYESVPVDWYAVPRFPRGKIPSTDGYVREIHDRWGSTKKTLPTDPARPWSEFTRIFENHVVGSSADWSKAQHRFEPSTQGRFPDDWEHWCARSNHVPHPVVLSIIDPLTTAWNIMGAEGDTGLLIQLHENPDLIRRMIDQLTELVCVCVEKACREARVDMVILGSDCTPILGPRVIREFALESFARIIDVVKTFGVNLVCLSGRGDVRPLVEMFSDVGVNGIEYINETGDAHYFDDLVDWCGDERFCIGCFDGRVLLESNADIRHEVERKWEILARKRILPVFHSTRLLPNVTFQSYAHYVECLQGVVFGTTS
jgi:hypothetical protein